MKPRRKNGQQDEIETLAIFQHLTPWTNRRAGLAGG